MTVAWRRVRELFELALDAPPEARAALLERECAGDAETCDEVASLLAAHDGSDVFLAAPVGDVRRLPSLFGRADAAGDDGGLLEPGALVDGRYRVEAVVGRGGMGVVYLATQLSLRRRVALKVMREASRADASARARFEREAHAIARLSHPNVVKVHDFGAADGVGSYIVMEHVEGYTLRDEIARRGPIPWDEAVRLVSSVCAGVAAAHRAGVIHCDLKPENVLLEPSEDEVLVKVLDFGLARLADAGAAASPALCGTPAYMSPEQFAGAEATERSDVYAIGCVAYELVTGSTPPGGVPPSRFAPSVPQALDAAILRAIAEAPEDRFPDVAAFAAALGAPGARPARGNLEAATSSFVGREREVAEVAARLGSRRLVTLVGLGGIGKTRLAREAARAAAHAFPDGVWVVALDGLDDPGAVGPALARALGKRESAGRGAEAAAVDALRDRRALVVLDDCDRVVAACAGLVTRLLDTCPGVRVLATSRERLRLAGESVLRVSPLHEADARGLFADRTALAAPFRARTEASAAAEAAICERLDGIPLAIELVAARASMLSAEETLERLGDRFGLAATARRGVPARRRTLRATIDWSVEMLDGPQRALLRRLAVFAGGWTREAAGHVCGGEEGTLDRLVEVSLVTAERRSGEVRYRMLETVRAYALERLLEAGEAEALAKRHALAFADFADAVRRGLGGRGETHSLDRLGAEHDNLRAALTWLRANEPEAALRTCAGLFYFWSVRAHFAEGRWWLDAALDAAPDASLDIRIPAIRFAGELAWRQGDLETADRRMRESLALAREAGRASQIAWSLYGVALVVGDAGDPDASRALLEECLARASEAGIDRLAGNALNSLGERCRAAGDWQAARAYYERALETHRHIGHEAGAGVTLCNLAATAVEEGDLAAARAYGRDALAASLAVGDTVDACLALDAAAAVAARSGDGERAGKLAGAAEAVRESVGHALEPADAEFRDRYARLARGAAGAAAFDAAVAAGRRLPFEAAARLAFSGD